MGFDALINYVSAIGFGTGDFDRRWPADYHVIGKDILVPAHSVYWPAMLHAIGVALPKHLLVHGWWHLAGAKMSKSTGVSIDPVKLVGTFGADAVRYFFIREMSVGQDSDFTEALFLSRYNSDLGNDLGNLLNRLLNMGHRYAESRVPGAVVDEEEEQALRAMARETVAEVPGLFDEFLFHTALERTFTLIRATNRYIEQRAPWKLAKSEASEDRDRLLTSLASVAEALRISALLLAPVMPDCSARILAAIGAPGEPSWDPAALDWGHSLAGAALGERTILFPRVEAAPQGAD